MTQAMRPIRGVCPACGQAGLMAVVDPDPTSEEEGFVVCVMASTGSCSDSGAAQRLLDGKTVDA